jgi:hypothetical protein
MVAHPRNAIFLDSEKEPECRASLSGDAVLSGVELADNGEAGVFDVLLQHRLELVVYRSTSCSRE